MNYIQRKKVSQINLKSNFKKKQENLTVMVTSQQKLSKGQMLYHDFKVDAEQICK